MKIISKINVEIVLELGKEIDQLPIKNFKCLNTYVNIYGELLKKYDLLGFKFQTKYIEYLNKNQLMELYKEMIKTKHLLISIKSN